MPSTLRFFPNHRRTFAVVMLYAAVGGFPSQADEVTVFLKSGRSFVGFLDEQSNDAQLVLRQETQRAFLWRPIEWSRIEGAKFRGQVLDRTELRELATAVIAAAATAETLPLPADDSPAVTPPLVEPTRALPSHASSPAPRILREDETLPIRPSRVVAIDAEAGIANWNGGVEQDGIALWVLPRSANYELVPAAGSLEVALIGLRLGALRGKYVDAHGTPFPQVARWTRQLTPDDFGPSGALIRLPFQAIHPEFHTDLVAYGLITVRYAIPGHGVFATTVHQVRIRPYSPLRDALEQYNGRRFFWQEPLSRTQ